MLAPYDPKLLEKLTRKTFKGVNAGVDEGGFILSFLTAFQSMR
jgi:hypothetical protein